MRPSPRKTLPLLVAQHRSNGSNLALGTWLAAVAGLVVVQVSMQKSTPPTRRLDQTETAVVMAAAVVDAITRAVPLRAVLVPSESFGERAVRSHMRRDSHRTL